MEANTPDTTNPTPNSPTPNRVVLEDLFFKLKHLAFKVLPIIIFVVGAAKLYHELVNIFYIFPHLPELYKLHNFSDDFFISIYRRSILITATATVGMIYAGVLINHREHLAHWLHIVTGIFFLILSQFILRGAPPIEPEGYQTLPPAPSIENLMHAKSLDEAFLLFIPKSPKESDKTSTDTTLH